MRVNGEPRTSIYTTPTGAAPRPQGRRCDVCCRSRRHSSRYWRRALRRRAGRSRTPRSRGAGERCIISFGRNGGPPMLANGFYNNNYQFVQTPDHILINVEMNHDSRIVRLNAKHRT